MKTFTQLAKRISSRTLIINRSKQTFDCAPNCELDYNFISINVLENVLAQINTQLKNTN